MSTIQEEAVHWTKGIPQRKDTLLCCYTSLPTNGRAFMSRHTFSKFHRKRRKKNPCTLKVCHHQAQWWNTMAPGSTTNGEKSSVVMASSSSFRMEWFWEMKKNFRRFAWDNQVWIHFRSFKFCRLLRKRTFREGTFTFLFPRPDIDWTPERFPLPWKDFEWLIRGPGWQVHFSVVNSSKKFCRFKGSFEIKAWAFHLNPFPKINLSLVKIKLDRKNWNFRKKNPLI